MQNAETILKVIHERGWPQGTGKPWSFAKTATRPSMPENQPGRKTWNELLESRMTRKCQVRFGGGRTEKGSKGHLAGRLPYLEATVRPDAIRVAAPPLAVLQIKAPL
jgi:hypothetical protein